MKGIHEKGPSGPRKAPEISAAVLQESRRNRERRRLGVYSVRVQRLAGSGGWKATLIDDEGRLSYIEPRLVDALDALTTYIVAREDT
jgi:hypothetical protein